RGRTRAWPAAPSDPCTTRPIPPGSGWTRSRRVSSGSRAQASRRRRTTSSCRARSRRRADRREPRPRRVADVLVRAGAALRPPRLSALGAPPAIVAGIFLLLDPRTRYLRVALIPPALWKPLPVVAALGLPQPGLAMLQTMGSVTAALFVASALGILARVALV